MLPDAVRIIIELDSEVPAFHDERLANPVRVFVDLPATQTTAELVDRTIRFDADADVVRQVRIGRHPNTTTRVVLDAAGISSYSVYPLYSPYRLVIDFVKEATPTLPLQGRRIAAPTVASLPRAPAPPPVLPRAVPVQPLQGRRVAPPTAAALPRAASPPPLLPRETPLMPLPSTPVKTRPIAIVAQTPPSLRAALEGMVAAANRRRPRRHRTSVGDDCSSDDDHCSSDDHRSGAACSRPSPAASQWRASLVWASRGS